jgi:hypothetical protein
MMRKYSSREPPAPTLNDQYRQRVLSKVQACWITGVLEQSLHNAAAITLGLQEQPNVIKDPQELVPQQPDPPVRLLPPDTHILQVYEDAGGELLILGEPGSGKTTLLLELARDLLELARLNDDHQIPVVFNLSSWAVKCPTITDWLVEELHCQYQVPRSLGQSWVDAGQLLPLLDGLDEVDSVYCEACVEAINVFRQEHALVPIVLCSRRSEYLSQAGRVLLRRAVVVQPLTAQQIDDYLSSADEQLAAVRVALRDNPTLQELYATPLMLSMLVLAYRGKPDEPMLLKDLPMTQRQVCEAYVERIPEPQGIASLHPPKQTVSWLAWLAWQLRQRRQVEFFIEQMQPDWLSGGRLHRLFYTAVVRSSIGLVSGLLGGLLVGLPGVLFGALPGGLLSSLICGLVFGLVFGLTIQVKTAIAPVEVIAWTGLSWWRRLVRIDALRSVLIGGLIGGLVFGLANGPELTLHFVQIFGLDGMVISGLVGGLVSGLSCELAGASRNEKQREQTPIAPGQGIGQAVRKSVRTGLVFGLALGLLICLVFGLIGTLFEGLVYGLYGLVYGLFTGLGYGLVSMLVRWLKSMWGGASPDEKRGELTSGTPGQGIGQVVRKSVRAGLVGLHIGLVLGLLLGLPLGLPLGYILLGEESLVLRLLLWLVLALVLGLVLALVLGLVLALVLGLLTWLAFGLVSGLVSIFSSWPTVDLSGHIPKEQTTVASQPGGGPAVRKRLRVGLVYALVGGLIFGLVFGLLSMWISGVVIGLVFGLLSMWIFGVANGLLVGLTYRVETPIQPPEGVAWAWVSMWRRLVKSISLRRGLVFALIGGLIGGLVFAQVGGLGSGVPGSPLISLLIGLPIGLLIGLLGGLLSELIGGLAGVLSSEKRQKQAPVAPGQGIGQSARKGLRSGLTFGLLGGLVFGLVFGPFGLFFGLLGGTISGLIYGLSDGGVAYIQHIVLRLLLWRAGSMPLNYPRFLDYASERVLLYKVCGGYMFTHRMLLDYFTSLHTMPTLTDLTGQIQDTSAAP